MLAAYEHTVSALCYSIIQERCQELPSGPVFRHNDAVRFVLDQQRRMPDFLRGAFVGLTLLFDGCGLVHGGRRFHRLPHAARWRQVEAWRGSRLSFCRDLVRFYESLVLLFWYSEPYERAHQGNYPQRERAVLAR